MEVKTPTARRIGAAGERSHTMSSIGFTSFYKGNNKRIASVGRTPAPREYSDETLGLWDARGQADAEFLTGDVSTAG